ncbi:MAG: MotA/TolQ/ExbB proton channel family protein [Planctomycetes bacterium]|nr:MotA/TolQ/ExbB proton channel family protein [Planctomycetota bacterium]
MLRRITVLFTLLALALLASPAMAQEGTHKSLIPQFFFSRDMFGNILIWSTILLSMVGVALIVKNSMAVRKSVMLPEETVTQVEQLLAEKKYKEVIDLCHTDRSMFAKIMHSALSQAPHGFSAMRDSAEEAAFTGSAVQIRGMEVLNIFGALGPMVGLFGTVYGMINSFFAMASAGGAPKPEELAGGISAALVSTFWGLIVAIPAVLAYGMLRSKTEGLTEESLAKVMDLIRPFRPAPGRK